MPRRKELGHICELVKGSYNGITKMNLDAVNWDLAASICYIENDISKTKG